MKIGFVGLGKMGAGMAKNLLAAGHHLAVYNRTAEKADSLIAAGARLAKTPGDAAQDAEAVFTMLANDEAVRAVVWGENGIASGLNKGATHVSASTISVAFSRELTAEHQHRGQTYLAAPVFGRPEAAENKKLLVVAGGEQGLIDKLQPLFESVGRRTFVAGNEPWSANAFKLCGNFMISSMIETFSEAFTTLRKAGLNHREFLDVMIELFGSPVYQNYGRSIAERKYQPSGFDLKLGFKDVRQVVEFAQALPCPMPFASVLRDHFLSGMANGQDELDWSSVELVLARSAGLPTSS
jgi:3-hydroxyisobutyrate dehydrogenase-like beta-hydroxyacid dehydrogenase